MTNAEWEALIALIGLTAKARATMAQPVDVCTRPLYVLPDRRVLIRDWAAVLDALWLVF